MDKQKILDACGRIVEELAAILALVRQEVDGIDTQGNVVPPPNRKPNETKP